MPNLRRAVARLAVLIGYVALFLGPTWVTGGKGIDSHTLATVWIVFAGVCIWSHGRNSPVWKDD